MIDEKKLIEFINSDEFNLRTIKSSKSIQDVLLEFIAEQPKIGEWVPCSERLPENIGNYIIHVKTGTGEDYVGMWLYERGTHLSGKQTHIDDKQGYWCNAFSGEPINETLSETVIAWRPLPEPYKPNND